MAVAPSISVVIPAYNSAAFIEECVASAANQTLAPLEILVVDDGSPDDSAARAEAAVGPVRVLRQPNGGRGPARNTGLRAARGEFVAFLDADDALVPTSLAERADWLARHPDRPWLCTDAVEFDGAGRELRRFLDQFPWLDPDGDPFAQMLRGLYPLTSTVMARRSFLESTRPFPALNYGEDVELFLRLGLLAAPGVLREPLTRRRIHADQGSRSDYNRWHARTVVYAAFDPAPARLGAAQARALDRALHHAHFKLAEHFWGEDRLAAARRHFFASTGPYPWSAAGVAYGLASCLPAGAVRALRKLRGR